MITTNTNVNSLHNILVFMCSSLSINLTFQAFSKCNNPKNKKLKLLRIRIFKMLHSVPFSIVPSF